MIVRTYYSGGKFCSFDTDHMTEALPLNGNMLTNWALDLDDVNNGCLWLSCYYHEIAEAYREPIGPKGLPVARRRDGWSFLVADAEDMKTINRVTVDGELFLIRVCGELVDATELEWAYTVAEEIAYRARASHGFLARQTAEPGLDEVGLCAKMGFPAETYRQLLVSAAADARDSEGEARF